MVNWVRYCVSIGEGGGGGVELQTNRKVSEQGQQRPEISPKRSAAWAEVTV